MNNADWLGAIEAWKRILGDAHVLAEPEERAAYERNASGLKRAIPVILRPCSTEEVQAVVQAQLAA